MSVIELSEHLLLSQLVASIRTSTSADPCTVCAHMWTSHTREQTLEHCEEIALRNASDTAKLTRLTTLIRDVLMVRAGEVITAHLARERAANAIQMLIFDGALHDPL